MTITGKSLKDGTQVCFNTILDASNYLKLDGSHIRKCINGTRKSHGGYSWSVQQFSEEKAKKLIGIKKEEAKNLGDLRDNDIFADMKFTPEDWSEEEDEVIRNNYPHGKLADIVSELAKDLTAITFRAKSLGVKRSHVSPKNRSTLDLMNIAVDYKSDEISS